MSSVYYVTTYGNSNDEWRINEIHSLYNGNCIRIEFLGKLGRDPIVQQVIDCPDKESVQRLLSVLNSFLNLHNSK